MRTPIFRVTNDDDPSDYTCPCAVSLETLRELRDDGLIDDFDPAAVEKEQCAS